jgi:death on curing protein
VVREPIWIRELEALTMHAKQLTLFGGSTGVRDRGLLESALARPKKIWAYGEGEPRLARLATAYAFGISANHAFRDGNKRTALVVSFAFLEVNGFEVTASQQDAYQTILGLAAGVVSEDQLAEWFERNTAPR